MLTEKEISENGFDARILLNYNKTVIKTKLGKLYVYISERGWYAKKYEEGKEIYQMETIVEKADIYAFCFWLNNII